MQTQRTAADGGIVVAHGYGVKLYVERGHLTVHYGVGRKRETHRYNRATSKLRRVVVIGHTGYVTLEALRWIRDVGAAFVQLDRDGQLITVSAAQAPDIAALRRAQALAMDNSIGLEVARDLLREKVGGQVALLDALQASAVGRAAATNALADIDHADELPVLLAAEAAAANAYWSAWAPVPVRFGRADARHVPDHWLWFGQRHSPLTSSPRLACNPPNAILNYLYALLEAETTLACHAVGLDPGLGFFHADRKARASLALDVMEASRPIVDAYLLALLTQRTLARGDFIETRQGACRLKDGLAVRLAETTSTWRGHVAPVVEGVAHTLAAGRTSIATPLTRAQHLAAWDERAPYRQHRQPRAATPALPNACRDCGTYLPDRRRRYCEHCRAQRWATHAARGRRDAAAVLAQLRAEQRDPAHGGRAAQARGAKNAAHQQALRAWEADNVANADPAEFAAIQGPLRSVPVAELVGATGLSEHYCSLIRLGKRVPHRRHWGALRATVAK